MENFTQSKSLFAHVFPVLISPKISDPDYIVLYLSNVCH